jgi:type IV pilus assembly protein PilC
VVRSLIAAGEQAGQLAPALQQAEALLETRRRARARIDPTVTPYAFAVLAITVLVTSGLLVIVVPKFEEIFADYAIQLPPPTIRLIFLANAVLVFGWPLMPLFVAGLALAVYLRYRPRHTPNLAWTSRVADTLRWHLPGLRRMQSSAGMASMLPMMRHALRAGMSLPDAVRLASSVDANHHLRMRMQRFASGLAAGGTVAATAAEVGLDAVTCTALASGTRSGDMDGALRFAADYHAACISRLWVCLQSLAWPLCTLVLASIVGSLVYALFAPLVALIEAVIVVSGLA